MQAQLGLFGVELWDQATKHLENSDVRGPDDAQAQGLSGLDG